MEGGETSKKQKERRSATERERTMGDKNKQSQNIKNTQKKWNSSAT
jgi:hypothetical protein